MEATQRLPLKLAGPIVRRVSPHEIHIWLLLSQPVAVRGRSLKGPTNRDRYSEGDVIGQTVSQSALMISTGLHLHLLRIAPRSGTPYLEGSTVVYDVEVELSKGRWTSIVKNDAACCLKGMHYPSVPIPSSRFPNLHVLYGSCRKLHASGRDPLPVAMAKIDGGAMPRPHALVLSGDQLYADEVSQLLAGPLGRLASQLDEANSGREPDLPLSRGVLPPLGQPRSSLLKREAGYSTSEGEHHLLRFWEFVAHYLVSFNAALWPSAVELKTERDAAARREQGSLVTKTGSIGRNGLGVAALVGYRLAKGAQIAAKLDEELRALEESRSATTALSRMMANTSTLMVFDDHEVTDDWNLTKLWVAEVEKSPIGHRVIANALASFWIFQGYGNAPDRKDCPEPTAIAKVVGQYLVGKPGAVMPYVTLMRERMRWSFAFSETPPVFCLDTRTLRCAAEVTAIRTGPNEMSKALSDVSLVDVSQFEALKAWLAALDRSSQPLIISPVPLFAFALLETIQREGSDWSEWIARMLDNEGWRSNPGNFYRFAEALTAFKGESIVVLSGDLHFGFVREATISLPTRVIKVLQLTSSAIRNEAPWAVQKLLSWSLDHPPLKSAQTWWEPKNGTIPVLNVSAKAEDFAAFAALYGTPTFKESSGAFDLRRPAAPGGVPARNASLLPNHMAMLSFGQVGLTNTFILDPESAERVVPIRWQP